MIYKDGTSGEVLKAHHDDPAEASTTPSIWALDASSMSCPSRSDLKSVTPVLQPPACQRRSSSDSVRRTTRRGHTKK